MKTVKDNFIRTPLGDIIDSAELWRRAKLKLEWEAEGYKYSLLRAFRFNRKPTTMTAHQREIVLNNFPEAKHLFNISHPQTDF